ncbi:hypothetical protein GCM10009563_13490 [Subtercola frigoramans]
MAVTLAMATVATAVFGTSAAMADDSSGGVGITVTVAGSPTSSAVTSTNPAGTKASPSKSNTGSGSSTVVTPTTPSTNKPVAAPGEFDLGGLIFLSGVTSDYAWSINPLAGESHAQITVHNVSTETIDSTADFVIVGPFGNEISRVDAVPIAALKPDESRTVDATFTGLGQWTFHTTHVTFVPPPVVQGTELTPVTRDGFMFVLPWFLLVLLILAIGTYSVVRIIREAEFEGAVVASSPSLGEGVA